LTRAREAGGMASSDLVDAFARVADGDPGAPAFTDLLADLQAATERGVAAIETLHDDATADAATIDPDADADAYVDVVERVEDVGYLAERVHAQTELVGDLIAAADDEPDAALAERVLAFVDETDGDRLPSERAVAYRDAVATDDD
jgi:hypothetical protein